MRRMGLAVLVAASAFAGATVSSPRVEAGGSGPGQGYDVPYNQGQYAQDQYAQGPYAQDQHPQGRYAQDQYNQGRCDQGQYNNADFASDQFYDALAPFGEWVHHPGHGYVWLPRAVAADWRPFTVGNWLHTEEHGWYWNSYEPFAWAVYHYGRWGFDPDYGWYWVPGDPWAPAWVQWRYGGEYVGWAPEAPIPTGGYAYGGVQSYAPAPAQDAWVFVKPRYLASPAVRSYALPRARISIAFSRTTYVNRPIYRDGHVYNYGMPRKHWSRITGRYVEPRRIYRGRYKARPKSWKGRGRRDVYVYAPRVKKGAHPHRPPKIIAHKPPRKKGHAAKRNHAKNQASPRGVMNPGHRGLNRGGQRHPLANYDALDPRKGPPGRPAAKPPHGKPKNAKYKDAKHRNTKTQNRKAQNPRHGNAKPHDARRNQGANRNTTARNGPHRSGPHGAARPGNRGSAGGGRHSGTRHETLGPRKATQTRPGPAKRTHAKRAPNKPKAARSKPNTSKGAKSGSTKNSAKKGRTKTKPARSTTRARAMGVAPTGANRRDPRRPAAYASPRKANASVRHTASKPKKTSASKRPQPKKSASKSARAKTAHANPARVKSANAKQRGAKAGGRQHGKGRGKGHAKGRGQGGGKRG